MLFSSSAKAMSLFFVDIGDDNIRIFLHQVPCNTFTESLGSTGDNDYSVFNRIAGSCIPPANCRR